ncbi:unnamed protein product [Pleuronectes platessa]|uniref:Uncharacterized protein n=1 Tax=Pleuronectes platessa TaxID=8262 RepID=A0A9N7YQ89_PLEPL|nr:unnamed protein product [Pleuronectes platessa]
MRGEERLRERTSGDSDEQQDSAVKRWTKKMEKQEDKERKDEGMREYMKIGGGHAEGTKVKSLPSNPYAGFTPDAEATPKRGVNANPWRAGAWLVTPDTQIAKATTNDIRRLIGAV